MNGYGWHFGPCKRGGSIGGVAALIAVTVIAAKAGLLAHDLIGMLEWLAPVPVIMVGTLIGMRTYYRRGSLKIITRYERPAESPAIIRVSSEQIRQNAPHIITSLGMPAVDNRVKPAAITGPPAREPIKARD